MDFFISLVFIWGLITLVGHYSWVLLAKLYQSLAGAPPVPRNRVDRDGFNAILDRLVSGGQLSREEAAQLWDKAEQIGAQPEPPRGAMPIPQPAAMEPDSEPVFSAELVEESSQANSPVAAPHYPLSDRRAWSEVVASFLAVHNIRWGELVAGVMIVFCSIGLVMSLWSTLTTVHRVVPSIVFMTANAAIFLAGFYTLAKWKLRHTSRAVLLIATLLVPLSVMAGLATTGDIHAAVSLTDPITLIAIVIGVIVNSVLLLGTGRALYGSARALAFAVAVAGPTLIIPLIPALLRTLGDTAGYVIAAASFMVAGALIGFQKPRRAGTLNRRYLSCGSRHQWSFLGVSVFSLTAVVLAFAYIGRDQGSPLWNSLLIGCLPALAAWAIGTHWTKLKSTLPSHQFVGQVICILSCSLIFVALPVLASGFVSLWLWAIVSTSSFVGLWSVYRRPPWLAIASVPVGIAAALSSTSWMRQVPWESVPWTHRILGGEPMISGLVLAAITIGLAKWKRGTAEERSLLAVAATWFGLTAFNATVLAFAGEDWFGIVPRFLHIAILAILVSGSVYAACTSGLKPIVAGVLTAVLACSLFHPITLAPEMVFGDEKTWLLSLVFSGAVLAGCIELAKRIATENRQRILTEWSNAACLYLVGSLAVIAVSISNGWGSENVATMLTVVAVWLVVSIRWLTTSEGTNLTSSLGLCLVPCAVVTSATLYWDRHFVVWFELTAVAIFVFSEAVALISAANGQDRLDRSTLSVSLIAIVCGIAAFMLGPVFETQTSAALALVSLSIVGLVIGVAWGRNRESRLHHTGMRLACGLVLFGGGWTLANWNGASGSIDELRTLIVVWTTGWMLYWQSALMLRNRIKNEAHTYAAVSFAVISVLLVAVEIGHETIRLDSGDPTSQQLLLFAVRALFMLLLASLTWVRSKNAWTLGASLTAAIGMMGCSVLSVAHFAGLSAWQAIVVSVIAASMLSALAAMGLTAMVRLHRSATDRLVGIRPAASDHGISILWPLIASVVVSGIAAVSSMMWDASYGVSQLLVSSIAIAAFGMSELAERFNRTSLQRLTLATVFLAIYMAASVPVSGQMHPLLCGTMRWFIVSVAMIPALMWAVPKVFGEAWTSRWRGSLDYAAYVCGVFASGSLLGMLIQESMLRDAAGIPGLPLTLIVGVAMTIAVLSGVAAWISIQRLELNDSYRRGLIITAQALGLVAWLHLFLCRREFAMFGLQAYWPYLVLFVAFLSVGLVEFLKRRGDSVLAGTLGQTSLYLPLIPAIGMLMSGGGESFVSAIPGIRSLTILLTVAAGYYIWLSRLWNGLPPKVLMVLFANSAFWSLLAQRPGWDFFSHPQFWLIPPAICVLIVAQMNRERLDARFLAAIRYSATILIYVSSTADMLVHQIGSSLWGPVILILLALTGIAAGVIFRVRPFLYLGSFFVLVGVISMVWHAQRSIDQVWPWWVFGITTGVGLLVALMSIEKNKGKLQQLSARLATWES
ncbi:hypothetical protein Pla52o_15020 [Novipirellula galeiformis]|uniref:Uncharacterized protein n=1 Tax=Novipirellula galeiformis TaxID=2528004 RepID=A0A5C6CP08_9BACT|nr:hypothetical protein [Novipirellula galeiformis]TWU25204.1 hypothetical protein Pla52o_15020 [Novipirellula galeiformis]